MTKANTCQGAMHEAKACTLRTDNPIRAKYGTGSLVVIEANPYRQMNGTENSVAVAYCQKVSD